MSNSAFLNLGVLLLTSNSIRSQLCELDILEMANEFLVMNLSLTQYSPVQVNMWGLGAGVGGLAGRA